MPGCAFSPPPGPGSSSSRCWPSSRSGRGPRNGVTFLFNPYNAQGHPVAATAPLLLGIGQTFVMISGGIDLSVGFVMGLARRDRGPGHADAGRHAAWPPLAAGLAAAFLVWLIPGGITGTLIAQLARAGLHRHARHVRGRARRRLPGRRAARPCRSTYLAGRGGREAARRAGSRSCSRPSPCSALHFVLSQTRFGQHTYAIGGNREAALRAGIDVAPPTVMIYLISAGSPASAA